MTRRNEYGVAWSIDQYRTINGERYESWTINPTAERIAAYRAAGVRCRRQGHDLYVHHLDMKKAAAIDAETRP